MYDRLPRSASAASSHRGRTAIYCRHLPRLDVHANISRQASKLLPAARARPAGTLF